MSLVALIVLIMVGYAGDSPHPSPPLNLASPTIANRTSTALVVLPAPPDRLPKCPIRFRILPITFRSLLKVLEFYHHVKVTARLCEHNCGKHANSTEIKHEAQQHLNDTHQTKEESLLPIPSRPRVYNYSVCSMEDTPPTLTCYLWEAPTTSSARMCPAPDVNNSTNSKTVHVDTKPLGAIIATPRLPTYLLSYEWKLNTITSVLILPAPSSKPPTILSGQKPVKPPKTSPPVEISLSFFFWPWFNLIAICLFYKLVVSLARFCVKWAVYRKYILITIKELHCFANYHFQLFRSNATMVFHFLSLTVYTWVCCYLHRGRTTIIETQKQNKERRPHMEVRTEQLPFSDLITVPCVATNSHAEVDEVNASEQVESNSSSSDEAGIIPHAGEPGSTTTEFLPPSCKVSGSASIDSDADMLTPEDEISNNGSSSNIDHSLKRTVGQSNHKAQTDQTGLQSPSNLEICSTSCYWKKRGKHYLQLKPSPLSVDTNDPPKAHPSQTVLLHSSNLKIFGTSRRRKKGRKSHPQRKPSPLSMVTCGPPNRKVQPCQILPHSSNLKIFGTSHHRKKGRKSHPQRKPSPLSMATDDSPNNLKSSQAILLHPFSYKILGRPCHRKKRGKPRPWNSSPLSTDRKLSSPQLPPVGRPSQTHPSDRRIFSLPYTRKKRVKNRHFRITRKVFLIPTKDASPARLQPKHPSLKKDPPGHFLPCTKQQLLSRENSHNWKDKEMDGVDNDGSGSSQSSPGSGGQSGNGGSQHRENGYDNGQGGEGGATGGTGGREGGEGGEEGRERDGGRDRHGSDDESSDEVQTEDENQQDEKVRHNLTETNDSGIGPSQSASSIPGLPASPPKLKDQVQNNETMPIPSSLMSPVQPYPDPKPPPHSPPSDTMDGETQPYHKMEPVRHRKERPHAEDSIQEWDREKDEQVCPNTHTIYPRWPEKSEEGNKGPQHTLKPFPLLSGEIDPGGMIVYDGLPNPPKKVLDEHSQLSVPVLSSPLQNKPPKKKHDQLHLTVTGAIENKPLKEKRSEIGDGEWENESSEDRPPEMHQQLDNSIPETSDGLLSCSVFTKAKQTCLPFGSCTAFVDGKRLPSWVGNQKSPWKQVQPSQEERGEVKVESEDGRSKPAVILLPPKLCPFYMRPLSREYKPVLMPALQGFRTCMEESFQPSLVLDTHPPRYMEAENVQNN